MKFGQIAFATGLTLALIGSGCSNDATTSSGGENLQGTIKVNGSSTVFPIAEAVAEEFQLENPRVVVTIGVSGTGGGFKKFAAGETDIQNASRPITEEEDTKMQEAGIDYIEIPVAYDGLTVVVNPKNNWADSLTVEELKKIWEPGSKITNWSQVRAGFPDVPLKLYGPGTDSGTFDYFTKEIVGEEKASRSDYQASEDDNTLVTGVSGDVGALGYFGYAYYLANKDTLKTLAIDNGKGPILPSDETINDGSYAPLSRPEFIYVAAGSAKRPEVIAFVEFFLGETGRQLISEVGYIPLPNEAYQLALDRFHSGVTGSVFTQEHPEGSSVIDILKK